MELATVKTEGEERLCLCLGEKIIDLNRGYALYAQQFGEAEQFDRKSFGRDMLRSLELGPEAVTIAQEVARFIDNLSRNTEVRGPSGEKIIFGLDEVNFRPPIPRPSKILCLAGNYVEHITETGGKEVKKEKTTPWVFMKPPTTLIGHKDQILIPKVWRDIDWEVELGVIIGKRGKYIPKEKAYDYVAGYTIFNDISARGLQLKENREKRDWDAFFDWFHGKCMDTFAPVGPCIVLKDQIKDVQNLRISLKVNKETKQDSNTANMFFTVPEVVEFISQIMTLEVGDIIATGTPSGIGATTGEFLKPGDIVEAQIEGIGTLINPVEEELPQ